MSSTKNKYFFEIRLLLVAFMFACGLWYIVVGNTDVESDVLVRVEYGSLPASLVISENIIDSFNVRVRASSEGLQRLERRDLSYLIDLSKMEDGANVIPIEIDEMLDFKGFDILSIDPAYVVVEVDSITTKILPIQVEFIAMKNDDLQISNVSVYPSTVEIQGPAAMLRDLEYLTVSFDLNKVGKEGRYSRPLQLVVSEHLVVTIPVVTLSFDVVAEKTHVEVTRPVSLDDIFGDYRVQPRNITLTLDVPAGRVKDGVLDSTFVSQIRVIAKGNSEVKAGDRLVVQVITPQNMKLIEISPSFVVVQSNK